MVIGLSGYADFPRSTHGNVLSNYCVLDPSVTARGTAPRVIAPAFGAIAITVLMAYPVNIYPCRYTLDVVRVAPPRPTRHAPSGRRANVSTSQIWQVLFGHLGEKHRVARHVGLTVAIAGLGLLIALVVPDISTVFELMGGTASAYVCFIMPAAYAWRLRERIPQLATRAGRAGCIGLFLVGLLVGVLSTSATIAGLGGSRPDPIDACNATQVAQQMCASEPGSGDEPGSGGLLGYM